MLIVWQSCNKSYQIAWCFPHLFKADVVLLKGAVIGIDDEDDSTFTITVDQNRSYYFQGDFTAISTL